METMDQIAALATPTTQVKPRMPAEWEPQTSLWLSWPTSGWIWPNRHKEIQTKFAELVSVVAQFQPVNINARATAHSEIEKLLRRARVKRCAVHLRPTATDDVWIRDHGPIALRDSLGRALLTNWEFNAWGGKFPRFAQDNAVPTAMAHHLMMPVTSPCPGYVLEGGAIESDGNGIILTTDPVLLNPNRNPDYDRAGHENVLREGLGADRVISLPYGLPNDDTDGHIDNVARFTPSGAVLLSLREDLTDLATNRSHLEAAGYTVEPLPLPRLPGDPPASYANYVVLNRAVLIPTFGLSKEDRRAMDIVQAAFPDRKVVPIDARLLLEEGGGLHCCTWNEFAD